MWYRSSSNDAKLGAEAGSVVVRVRWMVDGVRSRLRVKEIDGMGVEGCERKVLMLDQLIFIASTCLTNHIF